VQYAPGLFRQLKAEIDRDRHAMGRFILTGSQQFVLMKGVSESLAGRCAIVELENLSREEIGAVQPLPEASDAIVSLMVRGQFPELWRVPELPRREARSSFSNRGLMVSYIFFSTSTRLPFQPHHMPGPSGRASCFQK
jgi:predicted AAA+ superfamily ATPase